MPQGTNARPGNPPGGQTSNAGSTYQSVILRGQKEPASEQTRGIPARNTTGVRR
jgi:hypothetical protein